MNSISFNETYLTLAYGLLEIEPETFELDSSFLWTASKRLILNISYKHLLLSGE